MSTTANKPIGKRHSLRAHFQHNADMDFYLFWVLSYVSERGGEPGEMLAAADRINEDSPASWVSSWLELAESTKTRAEEAARSKRRVSAREAYLRAFTYFRAASLYQRPRDPAFRETWLSFERCFQAAAALSDTPCTPVAIPFGGWALPGYWLQPSDARASRPTLIMIGGGESYREDLYFWAGAAGVRRGYNVLLVDLPGQGATPFAGMALQAASEAPIAAIIDHLCGLPGVDPQRIAIHGLSGGGYFVSRAAAFERRLAACIANSPITDLGRIVTAEMPAFLKNLPAFASDAAVALAGRQSPALQITLEKVCWQAGVERLSDFVKLAEACKLEGLLERITCPILSLSGDAEGDQGEVARQARTFFEQTGAALKAEHIFRATDGADAHCQVGNFALGQQVAFDWLDSVLA